MDQTEFADYFGESIYAVSRVIKRLKAMANKKAIKSSLKCPMSRTDSNGPQLSFIITITTQRLYFKFYKKNKTGDDTMINVKKWEADLEMARSAKDEFFGSGHPQSPISPMKLQKFKGLAYYPPDPAYRFELDLHEHKEKTVLKVQDTKGWERELIRWGEFRFTINGKDCTLQAYKSDPAEKRLFVPFRDATSGKETYGAGRYLDLEPESHLTAGGKWIVDFNVAYNPWCAYSEAYACPFVAPENWLEASVLAGEKNYILKRMEETE
jgi:uncharacterized protein (DUF1684 family)